MVRRLVAPDSRSRRFAVVLQPIKFQVGAIARVCEIVESESCPSGGWSVVVEGGVACKILDVSEEVISVGDPPLYHGSLEEMNNDELPSLDGDSEDPLAMYSYGERFTLSSSRWGGSDLAEDGAGGNFLDSRFPVSTMSATWASWRGTVNDHLFDTIQALQGVDQRTASASSTNRLAGQRPSTTSASNANFEGDFLRRVQDGFDAIRRTDRRIQRLLPQPPSTGRPARRSRPQQLNTALTSSHQHYALASPPGRSDMPASRSSNRSSGSATPGQGVRPRQAAHCRTPRGLQLVPAHSATRMQSAPSRQRGSSHQDGTGLTLQAQGGDVFGLVEANIGTTRNEVIGMQRPVLPQRRLNQHGASNTMRAMLPRLQRAIITR